MTNKLLLTMLFALVFSAVALAQNRTVSGKVTGADDGLPLPQVSVLLKGSGTGVATNIDGEYQIDVPDEGGTLVFRYLGYVTQEVEIGNRSVVDVILSADVRELQEVVVTALGVSRDKASLGYSVQKVDGSNLENSREINVVNALQGEIAGVQIQGTSGALGGSSRITIRGSNSFLGNNQPLFVVDGVPIDNSGGSTAGQERGFGGNQAYDYGNRAQDINPADIESVNVLKGAAATALYGVRGSNGVILITTKSGKGAKGIGVEVSSAATFDNPLRLIPHQQVYGGGSINPKTKSGFTEFTQDGVKYLAPVYEKDGSWGPKYDPKTMVRHWDSWDPKSPEYKKTRPWVAPANDYKAFFETGVTLTNSVAVTGANDKGNFRLGYTNVDQKGIMPNQRLKRNTVTINSGYNLTDKLKANVSASYIRTIANGRNITGYNNGNPMQAFTQWWQTNLDVTRLKRNYLYRDGVTQYTWNPRGISTDKNGNLLKFNNRPRFFDNPYFARNEYLQEDVRDRLVGNLELSYQISDKLSASVKAMRDGYSVTAREGIPKQSVDQSAYRESYQTFTESNLDARLSYANNFGDFSMTAIVGGNLMEQSSRWTRIATSGGIALDKFWNISNTVQPITQAQSISEQEIRSAYQLLSLGWKDMVFIDGSLRTDWASTLPVKENPFSYAAVTGSFIFSELAFIPTDIISFGKIRAGYGQGANAPSPYSLANTWAPQTPNFGTNPRYALPNTKRNPNLKPEFTTEVEVGLELNFFNNRLRAEASYYNRKTTNQIFDVSVSPATGYTRTFINAGKMTNSGLELTLSGTAVEIGDFQWEVSTNFATYNNKVVEIDGDIKSIPMGSTWAAELRIQEGKPYMAVYGGVFEKNDKGQVIVNEKGEPKMAKEREYLGSAIADFTGGVRNTFRWKGFSLSGLIDFQQGGVIHSTSLQWAEYSGMTENTVFQNGVDVRDKGYLVKGVTKDGKPNTVRMPAQRYFQNYFREASRHVYSAGFIKLRELSLNYTLPQSLLGKLPFRDVTLGVFGRNLLILHSDVPHLDPQVITGTGNRQGLENAQVPSTRSIGFNLNFKL